MAYQDMVFFAVPRRDINSGILYQSRIPSSAKKKKPISPTHFSETCAVNTVNACSYIARKYDNVICISPINKLLFFWGRTGSGSGSPPVQIKVARCTFVFVIFNRLV